MNRKITLLFISVLAVALYSCENKSGTENPEPKAKFDPNSVLSIPISNIKGRGDFSPENLRYITRYAWDYTFKYQGIYQSRDIGVTDNTYYRDRDTVNNRLRFMGWDIIDYVDVIGGDVRVSGFMEYRNIILRTVRDSAGIPIMPLNWRKFPAKFDTVAYIPNAIAIKASADINKAFSEGNFEECYRLFDNAYVFVPCSGAEYRKLVADSIEIRIQ